jgi:hypothetical protein
MGADIKTITDAIAICIHTGQATVGVIMGARVYAGGQPVTVWIACIDTSATCVARIFRAGIVGVTNAVGIRVLATALVGCIFWTGIVGVANAIGIRIVAPLASVLGVLGANVEQIANAVQIGIYAGNADVVLVLRARIDAGGLSVSIRIGTIGTGSAGVALIVEAQVPVVANAIRVCIRAIRALVARIVQAGIDHITDAVLIFVDTACALVGCVVRTQIKPVANAIVIAVRARNAIVVLILWAGIHTGRQPVAIRV